MQFPSGTFCEIKKSELISSIINDVEHTKFSGICRISSNTMSGTMVFESGNCILAKIQDTSGIDAWEDLLKMGNHKVDATFSNLDEAQVRQALEFNKECRIIKSVNTTLLAALQLQKPAEPAYADPQIRVCQPQDPTKPVEIKELPKDTSSFDRDIDTFDNLDIDSVTDKIRNDCKTIIRQLNLEHLMER